MTIPDSDLSLIRDALTAYKKRLRKLAGEHMYSLEHFPDSESRLTWKNGQLIDRRRMFRDLYIEKAKQCNALLENFDLYSHSNR